MGFPGGFPGGSDGKESSCNVGDLGSTLGLGRSPAEGKGYPLQCSGLENSMDCIVQGSQRMGHNRATFTSPGGSVVKNLLANVGDVGSVPRLGRSPGVGNGNPFQYSSLENPMDRGAWKAILHRITKKSDITW